MRRFPLLLAGVGLLLTVALLPAKPPTTPHKAYTEKIPGTQVSFDMVPIPAGSFVMGSPTSEAGRGADEGPQHTVKVPAFWMGKYEVTWDEYDLYWKDESLPEGNVDLDYSKLKPDAVTRPTPAFADETFGHGREKHPVLAITHNAAMAYCHWLSKKTGKIYRLPTEAEWEYACRAGTTTPYFFGNDPKQLGDYAWYAANSEELTHEVGKKKPNPWGLYDMLGNVAEYCLDHYSKDDYSRFPEGPFAFNVHRLPMEKRFSHAVRGGSWADDPPRLRSAARRGSDRSWLKRDPQRPQSIWWLTDADFVGFRVVRAVEESPEIKKHLGVRLTRQSPYGP